MTVGPDKKIILLSGSGDTVAWFRLDFLNEFLLRSYKVYVLAPDIRDDLKPELINMGIEFIEIKLERKGFNVLNLISSVFELVSLFKEIQPNIIFSYTHKAILSGSLAAKISGFSNTFSMVTGTGHIFDNQTKKEKVIKFIGSLTLRLALRFNKLVFFQNPDDQALFVKNNIVLSQKTKLVNGSGVNLDKFSVSPLPSEPVFLCMARLIKSKGLEEFARAAKRVKKLYPEARFILYGYPDEHPDSIDENEIISNWFYDFGVEYFGYSENPTNAIKECSVFVLLSYKEGTPRVVLEAMAMGRPIITTDAPGCRETVKNEVNGFLVPIFDDIEAANAMTKLLSAELRREMGQESRQFCQEKFNVVDVNNTLLSDMGVIN
ncbi:glycosyltransferase family 4 protein [Gammaproteobacteria bacterium]|jgi:glycosyltransferase involved in cell wall biosynthesis|nr:glycosyltransferase family 4 protein [Gammaproteobacteria bacterium]